MIKLARSNTWQTLDHFSDMSAGKCDFLLFFLIILPDHIAFECRLVSSCLTHCPSPTQIHFFTLAFQRPHFLFNYS